MDSKHQCLHHLFVSYACAYIFQRPLDIKQVQYVNRQECGRKWQRIETD